MKKSKKIVIKLGSSLLTNKKGGVNKSVLKNVVKDIVWLLNLKKEVIVVSSGAISLGKGKLNLNNDLTLNESQAVAARGQIELMTAWQNEFKKHKKQVAQILLSPSDIKNKKSSNNAMATLKNLLNFNCVPIINENDTTSTDEIKFGDNDVLAAQIAKLVQADHLILLSNVDGLYKEPPKNNKNDNLVLEVRSINKKIKDMAGAANMIGLANLIMGMNLPVHLRLMIPIVDNNLSANSYRPGDIFTARNGKTVEIGNTDAEGRLILADVLAAACEVKPDLIVDFATLTGNRALGSVVSCFSHDIKMTQKIQDCGIKCEDHVWSMPLIKQYSSLFESDVADLVNITNLVMDCGTATAAMFLNEFVDKEVPWVHCDTLGYNPRSMPGRPKGGEALGLRAFYHFISDWCQT